jgi:hypothetical protein
MMDTAPSELFVKKQEAIDKISLRVNGISVHIRIRKL